MLSFEKEDDLKKSSILSCLVQLKRFLCNLLCVSGGKFSLNSPSVCAFGWPVFVFVFFLGIFLSLFRGSVGANHLKGIHCISGLKHFLQSGHSAFPDSREVSYIPTTEKATAVCSLRGFVPLCVCHSTPAE